MRLTLQDKVAIVTGGASGIGRGIVERLAGDGAKVVLADVNLDAAQTVAAALGDKVRPIRVDISVEADIERGVAEAVSAFGRLDVAVNCAYRQPPQRQGEAGRRIFEFDSERWRLDSEHPFHVFLGIKHQARQMVTQGGGGSIIAISSVAARQPYEGNSGYCAAKAAVEQLVRCAAMELGPSRIRVNAVAPGLTETPATAKTMSNPTMHEAFVRAAPLGRIGRPADIAAAVAFLASDDADWVSGQTLTVDGAGSTRELPRRFELMEM